MQARARAVSRVALSRARAVVKASPCAGHVSPGARCAAARGRVFRLFSVYGGSVIPTATLGDGCRWPERAGGGGEGRGGLSILGDMAATRWRRGVRGRMCVRAVVGLVCECLLLLLPQVSTSGVFELRLKSFINDYGKDAVGLCCSGETTETCTAPCRTRFRVCLKHYQQRVDTTSPCTFGDVITPVLGDNSLQMDAPPASNVEGFNNPIRFPFDFTWPVSFCLRFFSVCAAAAFLLYFYFLRRRAATPPLCLCGAQLLAERFLFLKLFMERFSGDRTWCRAHGGRAANPQPAYKRKAFLNICTVQPAEGTRTHTQPHMFSHPLVLLGHCCISAVPPLHILRRACSLRSCTPSLPILAAVLLRLPLLLLLRGHTMADLVANVHSRRRALGKAKIREMEKAAKKIGPGNFP